MAAAGGLLSASLRLQARWGDAARPSQQMAKAFARLAQDVESARPLFNAPFLGSATSLEFVRVESAEWMRVRYRLDDGAEGTALVREASLWREGDGAPVTREVLLPLVRGAFAFGAIDSQNQRVWIAAWDGIQQGLPRLLAVDATLPIGPDDTPMTLRRVIRNPAGTLPVQEAP
jgi:hypothetical protein